MNPYVNMGVGALLGTVFVLMSVSIASEGIFHSEAPEKEGFAIVAAEGAAEGGEEAAGAGEAAVTPIATLLASADAGAGEAVFKKCQACHSGEKGGPNKVGPDLWDIVGRKKGSHAGFAYSDGLKNAGGEWTYDDIFKYLANPGAMIPGSKMAFRLPNPEQRAQVIAFLRTLSDSPKPLPVVSQSKCGGSVDASLKCPIASRWSPRTAPITRPQTCERVGTMPSFARADGSLP